MEGFRHIFGDWKRLLHHAHGRIALGFLILVPLIYLGLFLSGYWNPYGKLDKLPIAVVNEDEGAMLGGKPIHAGADFVSELQRKRTMDFRFVTAREAHDGLKDGTYYMTVTVPEDFSSSAASLMDADPKPARLLYETDAGRNFVASQVGSSAVKEMKAGIQASLTKAYADGVLSSMKSMADGLGSAGSGALTLHQGTEAAYAGLKSVADGAVELAAGTAKLSGGGARLSAASQQLKQGAASAAAGSSSLADGMAKLAAAQKRLQTGSDTAISGMDGLAASSSQAAADQAKLAADLAKLQDELAAYAKDKEGAGDDSALGRLREQLAQAGAASQALAASQRKLAAGADKLAAGEQRLQSSLKQFGGGLADAAAGASGLKAGTAKLSAGMDGWAAAFQSLRSGMEGLAGGASGLDSGTAKLLGGMSKLDAGTGELSAKLADAAQRTGSLRTGSGVSAMLAEPVQLVESELHEVPSYGVGIAPYFLSLALFVGGIMGANILPLGRRQDQALGGTAQWINKLGLFYTVGIAQTAIVVAIALFGFRIEPASTPAFIGFSLLASLTFLTIIYMLVTVFGFIGKFLSVTLLVVQLATCGGTFPRELSAPVLQAVGRYLPMTFSLHGFQSAISIGDGSWTAANALALTAWLAAAALVSLAFNIAHARRDPRLAGEAGAA
ncbi:YhgE/Pip family protein [Paenibacillus sp. D51F]